MSILLVTQRSKKKLMDKSNFTFVYSVYTYINII